MTAEVLFLMVFFAFGTLLMVIVHQALLADDEHTRSLAKVEESPASRGESQQDHPRDRAA